ncbi:hypothetical protein N7486_008850 [Penicillium sp. IBT 16267x]|nr:hypothetical protein N7486_008850 [Penicillium sp. IBT 16267x]
MIAGIVHVNLLVPPGTLDDANAFYGETMGLYRTPVPQLQRDTLAWFNITTEEDSQKVHIAFGKNEPGSSRHPCFKVESPQKMLELQQRIYDHYVRGDSSAPQAADKPGDSNSGQSLCLKNLF